MIFPKHKKNHMKRTPEDQVALAVRILDNRHFDDVRSRAEAELGERGTTLGPLASAAHHASVQARVRRGEAEGATLLGTTPLPEALSEGCYLNPMLFVGAHNRMSIAQDEIFGPVATVIPFDTEEEAIALANDSIYGLAASVWTADLRRAHRFVQELQAGVVWVNCFGDGDMTQPFGGFKQSGNSRDKHLMSLMSYTQVKSAWFNLG